MAARIDDSTTLLILLDSDSDDEDMTDSRLIVLDSDSEEHERDRSPQHDPSMITDDLVGWPSQSHLSDEEEHTEQEHHEDLQALAEQLQQAVIAGDAQQAFRLVQSHHLASLSHPATTLAVIDQVYHHLVAIDEASGNRANATKIQPAAAGGFAGGIGDGGGVWLYAFEALFQLLGEEGRAAAVAYHRLCVFGGTDAAWSGLSDVCERLGKKRLAVRALGRAERAALHSDWHRRRSYLLRRRQIYSDQGRTEDAHALTLLLSHLDDEQLEHDTAAADRRKVVPHRLARAYAQLGRKGPSMTHT